MCGGCLKVHQYYTAEDCSNTGELYWSLVGGCALPVRGAAAERGALHKHITKSVRTQLHTPVCTHTLCRLLPIQPQHYHRHSQRMRHMTSHASCTNMLAILTHPVSDIIAVAQANRRWYSGRWTSAGIDWSCFVCSVDKKCHQQLLYQNANVLTA